MPAVIVTELKYDKEKDKYSIDLWKFLDRFQVIKDDYRLYGYLEFCRIDKKVEREIAEPIVLDVKGYSGIFYYTGEEIIRKFGITPGSWVCVVLNHYSKSKAKYETKYPIYPEYFEIINVPEAMREEVENKFKGAEEILRLIELGGVAENLKEAYEHLKKAYIKFQSNFYEDCKTSARKTLEILREFIQTWKTVDNSKHLADGIKEIIKSLYGLSSSGGAHRGVATRDETEVILYSVFYLFKYLNKIIMERRFEEKQQTE